MKYIAVRDQVLAVEIREEGRPLVLLHGLGADSAEDEAVVSAAVVQLTELIDRKRTAA